MVRSSVLYSPVRDAAPLRADRQRRYEQIDAGATCQNSKCRSRLAHSPKPANGAGDQWSPKRWANVAIRCVLCYKTYCPKCAKQHFKPTVTSPGEKVTVKEIKAYAVRARGVTLAVCVDEVDAKGAAADIEYIAGRRKKPLLVHGARRKS